MPKTRDSHARARRSAEPRSPTVPSTSEFTSTLNRAVLLAIMACFVCGVVLRIAHLGIPMRYDEAHTFMKYALRGWQYSASTYDHPNNHVLHTLLVVISTRLFGESPSAIRLPALLAGCLVPLASAWLALRAHGKEAALLAAAAAATWPVLIGYSANARGYSLVVLLALVTGALSLELARHTSWSKWLLFGAVSVIGLYTVPVMLIPWLGLVLFLAIQFLRQDGEERSRGLLELGVCTLGVVAGTALCYAPILLADVPQALLSNRFIATLPWSEFIATLPAQLLAILRQWTEGVPLIVLLVLVLGLAADRIVRGPDKPFPLLVPLLAASVLFLVARRNLGYERVWLWLLPFVLVSASAGSAALMRRFTPQGKWPAWSLGLAASMAALLTANVLLQRPVWNSNEGGAYPEGEAVVRVLRKSMGPRDEIVTDLISAEPLNYYLYRRAGPPASVDGRNRFWITIHRDPHRQAIVHNWLRKRGLQLADTQHLLTEGRVDLYVFPPLPNR